MNTDEGWLRGWEAQSDRYRALLARMGFTDAPATPTDKGDRLRSDARARVHEQERRLAELAGRLADQETAIQRARAATNRTRALAAAVRTEERIRGLRCVPTPRARPTDARAGGPPTQPHRAG